MDQNIGQEILQKTNGIPKWIIILLTAIAVIGFGTFAINATGENASAVWQIFLVNFLFWTAASQGGIIFSSILRITDARWGRSLLRISEGLSSFLPLSFVLLFVIFLGKDYILPYTTHHYHHPKEIWLDTTFVASRNIIGFAVLLVLNFFYLKYSLKQDYESGNNHTDYFGKLRKLAPAIIIMYSLVFSFFAWDFMMSLDPHWFSTLFGPYYFIGGLISAAGATIILSVVLKRYLGLDDYLTQHHYWDMGKILQGFSLLWVYLMFSQFLPIWYANMPEEAVFVIKRVQNEPFKTFCWVVLSTCFVFPFFSLLPRTNKIVTPILVFIASVSFTGLWMDKFILVLPSYGDTLSFGLQSALITAGFMSAFLAAFLYFVNKFPVIPYGDPLFDGKSSHGGH